MAENPTINCPNCEGDMVVILKEFVDVSTDPKYKEQIKDGSFFLNRCPECGEETLIEYPLMYMDPDKKLNIYMAPDHEEDLLEQLNSVPVPEGDIDEEGIFRVVDNSGELLEKILMADSNRDDRVMELYKAVVCENIKPDMVGIQPSDLLYMDDGREEFFIIWPSENEEGEKLTVTIDGDLYNELKSDYGHYLATEPNKYVQVNQEWLLERIEVEE